MLGRGMHCTTLGVPEHAYNGGCALMGSQPANSLQAAKQGATRSMLSNNKPSLVHRLTQPLAICSSALSSEPSL